MEPRWHAANQQGSGHCRSSERRRVKRIGFNGFNSAVYTRDDGRKLTVRAARFQDASGAYGAFTYYKIPQMLREKIGDQGASFNERVLFYRGDIVIDAQFDKLSAMSAAELRDLSAELPPPRPMPPDCLAFLNTCPRKTT